MAKVLVSGGSGYLGRKLIAVLKENGTDSSILSRNPEPGLSSFHWDVKKQTMDISAFEHSDAIVHLAGSGIANRRWTKKNKKEIVDSRVQSAQLLFDSLKKYPSENLKTFISASAIGYYGNTDEQWVDESFRNSDDFLGLTCKRWEESSKKFEDLGMRVVILRIGLVLSKKHGLIPSLLSPVMCYAGMPLGTGNQFMSWIHEDDLIQIFYRALKDDKMHGVYNAVAPHPVTHNEFLRELGSVTNRPIWPLHVPSLLLRLALGEKADLVLNGQRVSSEKLRMAGFSFRYMEMQRALTNILSQQ